MSTSTHSALSTTLASSKAPSNPTTPTTALATSVLTAPSTAEIDFAPSTGVGSSPVDHRQRHNQEQSVIQQQKQKEQQQQREEREREQEQQELERQRERRRRLLHPIPISVDGGETLDWSGTGFELVDEDKDKDKLKEKGEKEKSEKRWSLSAAVSRKGKEKEKDKEKEKERELMLVLPNEEELKRHEEEYFVKLSRIKTISSQSTNKKVIITADQIGRRYNLIYDYQLDAASSPPSATSSFGSAPVLNPPTSTFNLLKVSKWYATQDDIVRASLESAEPFVWLKHLEKNAKDETDTTTATAPSRPPWHLSALIMEEYIHAQNAKEQITSNVQLSEQFPSAATWSMGPIPEHPSPTTGTSSPSYPDEGGQSQTPFIIPSGYATPSAYSAHSAYSPPSIYSNSTYSPPSTYSAPSAPYSPNPNINSAHPPHLPRPQNPHNLSNPNNPYFPDPNSSGRISFEPLLTELSSTSTAASASTSTAQEPPRTPSRYLQPSMAGRPSNESRRSLESTWSSLFGGVAAASEAGAGKEGTKSLSGVEDKGSGGVEEEERHAEERGITSPTTQSRRSSRSSHIRIRDSWGLRRRPVGSTVEKGNEEGNMSVSSDAAEDDQGHRRNLGEVNGRTEAMGVNEVHAGTARPGANVGDDMGAGIGSIGSPPTLQEAMKLVDIDNRGDLHPLDPAHTLHPPRSLRSIRVRNKGSLPTKESLAIEMKRRQEITEKQEAEEAREDMEYELKACRLMQRLKYPHSICP
ncbi:hypothetical protein FB446DRAFT_72267 [Lentinula raphanica]|nr:hypothetical protein FB446DRAFT_72267 [Lentinula raphanica]